MTTKKALEMIYYLIKYETKMQNTITDPTKSWNTGIPNIKDLAKSFQILIDIVYLF